MDRLDFPENCLDVVAQFLIGLVIINEIDIDEAFEIVSSAWNYRNFEYDDFIEVLDMLEEERRVWVDWEENTYGKRGYSRMIYYTNIGTIAPDNSYLVFNAEGSILGQLSGSFVSNSRWRCYPARWFNLQSNKHSGDKSQRFQCYWIQANRPFLVR